MSTPPRNSFKVEQELQKQDEYELSIEDSRVMLYIWEWHCCGCRPTCLPVSPGGFQWLRLECASAQTLKLLCSSTTMNPAFLLFIPVYELRASPVKTELGHCCRGSLTAGNREKRMLGVVPSCCHLWNQCCCATHCFLQQLSGNTATCPLNSHTGSQFACQMQLKTPQQ